MISPFSIVLAQVPPDSPLQSFQRFFQDGGFFIYPLFLASIICVTVTVFKAISLRRATVVPEALAREIEGLESGTTAGRWEAIQNEFKRGQSTLGRLGALAVRNTGKSHDEINHAVEVAARGEMVRLHSGIQILDAPMTVAPLLGLLGTVSGLVAVFKGLSDTSDHIAIARGISEALHTTIFGICIAVVAVISHGWFTRRIELMTSRLECVLADLARVCARPSQP